MASIGIAATLDNGPQAGPTQLELELLGPDAALPICDDATLSMGKPSEDAYTDAEPTCRVDATQIEMVPCGSPGEVECPGGQEIPEARR